MSLLITVTASTLEELQWRVQEMKKLLISQDMDLRTCYFLQEQGFLSTLPWHLWIRSCISFPGGTF